LRADLQRDPAVGAPQELLDGLCIFPVRLLKSAESMAEGVATDPFVNAGRFCDRPYLPLHQIVRPVGFANPVWLRFTIAGPNLCYLCISMPDISFCISIIRSRILFISFAETLPLAIAMDISCI